MRDKVKKMENEWKKPAVQFEEAGEETKPDEDCMLEVDSEADSRKKLELRRSTIHTGEHQTSQTSKKQAF